ncbi:MAG TPA: glycosyltransferase [Candidatus Baltobacteraceae bacterium]|nr:glycosyltransferase [Candidatus Baltobacteraceae bacterium]
MKVLIISSGLGSVNAADERLLLDLASALRANGLDVTCWGSSQLPGVRRIPTLSRDDLQKLALYRLREDSHSQSQPHFDAACLHDWSLQSEELLFGIAAAASFEEELLHSNEPTVVYLKWHSGLVDAAGRSTLLLDRLARANQQGRAYTIIRIDHVFPPVLERLAGHGFVFHSVAPSVTRQLAALGLAGDSVLELPNGVAAEPLRQARSRRSSLRDEFAMPQDALVILSVGAFDSEADNFPYAQRELASLAKHPEIYWLVAGSRGKKQTEWECRAKEAFGGRFRPLVGVLPEKMPDLYGVADLVVGAGLTDPFGTAHAETLLSGLPFVLHESEVTQWTTAELPSQLAGVSRVDMRAPGALANAVSQWCGVLGNPQGRVALATVFESFRQAQVMRFSWESLGPKFVEAFRRVANPSSQAGARVEETLPATGPLRILVVHETLPQTDCGGADVRLMQVLKALASQGHAMTFVARLGLKRERYAPPLEALGFTVYCNDTDRLKFLGADVKSAWSFEEVVKTGQFDVAILCEWFWTGPSIPEHYMDIIRRVSPRTRIAVLSDDRHGLRELRKADLSKGLADMERGLDFQYRETETYRQADIVLAITEEDRAGFLEITPNIVTELVPMVAEKCAPGPGPARRKHLLFLGSFSNLANLDGLDWFFLRVWPLIHSRMPGVEMHLAGSSMPERCRTLGDGIVGLGQVNDLARTFAKYRVFVAPIRYGTGIKTKNLAAMAHRIPLVTTTIGAEGMNLHGNEIISIADDEESFAEAVVRLYQDDKLWRDRAKAGRDHILREFSFQKLDSQVARFIERVRTLHPKAFDPGHVPPYLFVERVFPEVLTHQPGKERPGVRMVAYVHLGERFLGEGKPAEALSQFRHAFHYLRGEIPNVSIFGRLLAGLERCYRELGDLQSAERCVRVRARDSKNIREPVAQMENRGASDEPPAAPEAASKASTPAAGRLSEVLG